LTSDAPYSSTSSKFGPEFFWFRLSPTEIDTPKMDLKMTL
jgi:hypothetical protein